MHKNIALVIPSFLFSLLFYQKNIGLNFLLFSIMTIVLLAIINYEKFKTEKILVYTVCYLGASCFVFMYNSLLTIFTSLVSFFVLLGAFTTPKSSLYIELINGFYTTIASFFFNYYNHLIDETEAVKKRHINYLYWVKTIGVPILIVVVFILLYRSANPNFAEILSHIDLSFINLKWILFTSLGYFLLLNISNPQAIQPLTRTDYETSHQLERTKLSAQAATSLRQENQLGVILLILLNLLIVFFLTTDIFYLNSLVEVGASSLSKTVHEGIYALITSLIFAIIIILYFFRGNLNFYTKNQQLKGLTTIWIVLNLILVLVTLFKNYLYVSHSGFTYKRIGVFVYLFLSLIGLITTYKKVHAQYNLWYLLRKNISIAFSILVLSCPFNWDQLITKYNTNYAQIIDLDYLIGLSNNNTLLLKKYKDNHEQKIPTNQTQRITEKYDFYNNRLKNNSWQEFVYDNLKIKK